MVRVCLVGVCAVHGSWQIIGESEHRRRMSESIRHQLIIVAVAAGVFLVNLGGARLFDEDEPKNAACGQEMLAGGEWIVPSFNAELRTDKPILLYWCMLASYHALGVNEFSARLPSALFAIGTTLLMYHLGRRLFNARAGFWAALVLATSVMFDVVARAATPDSIFIFFTTLTLLMFVIATSRISSGRWGVVTKLDGAATRGDRIAALVGWPYRYWLAMYAAMGLATLAKGPAGIVLPGGVMGLYLILASAPQHQTSVQQDKKWRQRLRAAAGRVLEVFSPQAILAGIWQMRPLTAIATVGAIALPWYIAVGVETSGEWLVGFLGQHNVNRFAQPLEGHSGPIFYYVIAIVIGFFPWSIFLTLMIVDAARRIREDENRLATLLVCCWAAGYIGFFSLARTKLPNYVLPAYPALALMAAAFIDNWIARPESMSRRLVRGALGSVPAVGLAMAVALPIVTHYLLPGEAVLAVVGVVLLVGGGVAVWLSESQRTTRAAHCLGATAVVFAVVVFGFGAERVSRHMTSSPFAETVAAMSDDAQLTTFKFFEPSLVFYRAAQIERCGSSEEVDTLLNDPAPTFVITTDDRVDEIAAVASGRLVEVSRQRRFLRPGELVLLGPPAVVARAASASIVQ
jgi:4-amino-4-deoxy-L-arabinose transferase-like glycosyltransferase